MYIVLENHRQAEIMRDALADMHTHYRHAASTVKGEALKSIEKDMASIGAMFKAIAVADTANILADSEV